LKATYPKLNEDSVERKKVITVVASSGGEVRNDDVLGPALLLLLMILNPLDQECLLANSALSLDDQWLVILKRIMV
jgi:CHAD domain-containing protein